MRIVKNLKNYGLMQEELEKDLAFSVEDEDKECMGTSNKGTSNKFQLND
jgi:hypothetical protein